MDKTIIIGSGISGISAGYHLEKQGEKVTIFEKDSDWGGLCGNFTIDGFRFDRFVHFTFADDEYIRNLFETSSPTYSHPSVSYNYYDGYWLKHPAQNNLAPLPVEVKTKIITDFVNRPQKDVSEIKDYGEWLRVQYGAYFAQNFPYKYTRKYWGLEPEELETKWVGNRMHSPDLAEVLKGSYEVQEDNFYYTKFMKYPKKGGFRSILNGCRKGLDIKFNKEVVKIDSKEKIITFKDGTTENYTRLISSMPLPEIVKMIDDCPVKVSEAANNLHNTCGYMVSLGFNRADVAKYLWFYIYDEDILAARVYSPNLKSADNVPDGCSSLQAEIFFDCNAKIPTKEEVLENTIIKLSQMGLFSEDEIVVKDVRFEKYANVTFDKDIYKNREIVLNYLKEQKIESIGRFGKWEYYWTHQAFKSGMEIAKQCQKI
jgi:protoporphyrinogen oxidase